MTSRGVGRGDVFLDDNDRTGFFDRCEKMVERFGWLVYAITLMTNHFHIFFRTPQANLSRGAQYLLSHYASRFNRRHKRSGHLFEGRFRCQVIEDDSYAWTVSRYVHLNPVPHLAAHPADWSWGSYAGYCDPDQRLPWVRYDDLLSAWEGDFGASAAAYRQYVEAGLDERRVSPFGQAIDGWILGGESFANRIRRLISPQNNEPTVRNARRILLPLDAIIDAACTEFNAPRRILQQKGRRHPVRSAIAHLARELSSASLEQIANSLGLARRDSVPSLARRAREASTGDDLYRKLIAIENRLQESSVGPMNL
ncbi:MAG: transposase, partial [Pirellulaceae bacterium]|nr:transposase [Pirellulaceae bacterium]